MIRVVCLALSLAILGGCGDDDQQANSSGLDALYTLDAQHRALDTLTVTDYVVERLP